MHLVSSRVTTAGGSPRLTGLVSYYVQAPYYTSLVASQKLATLLLREL